MRFAQGATKALGARGHNVQDVRLVIERLEDAVPHLRFDEWHVVRHGKTEGLSTDVSWPSADRSTIKVSFELPGDVRLWSLCEDDARAIPGDDHRFLLALAQEANGLLGTSLQGAVSLFDFGTTAVAAEIQHRSGLNVSPVAVLRFIRSLAQESYENERLSYGAIFTDRVDGKGLDSFIDAFDNKRAKRLTDGFSTALVLDANLRVAGYTSLSIPESESRNLPRRPWWCAGLATASEEVDGVGVALVRSGDILVVHRGRVRFSLRAGTWRTWNHASHLARLESAWGKRGNPGQISRLLTYLYHVALDLSFRRSGGLLVVLARKDRIGRVLSSTTDQVAGRKRGAVEKAFDVIFKRMRLQNVDRRITTDIASLDGAIVVDRSGRTLAFGAMVKTAGGANQGARARAAIAASRYGLAIKVSSDGNVSFYSNGKSVMEL